MANRADSYFPKGGHNPNRTESIMNKHKVNDHRNSDSKTGNRDHIRTTALEWSVMNYSGASTSFTPATSPYVSLCPGSSVQPVHGSWCTQMTQ